MTDHELNPEEDLKTLRYARATMTKKEFFTWGLAKCPAYIRAYQEALAEIDLLRTYVADMDHVDLRQWLQAELSEITKILAIIPPENVIERMSMERRKALVEAELGKAES
ncbi:MAG: hypothetical protein ABIH23_25590 [bacterium]